MGLRTDDREATRLFSGTTSVAWFLVLLVGLFVLPLVAESYLTYLSALAATHVIIAIGLNVLTGSTGQISLGHAGFVAIGAYASPLFMSKVQLPFAVALPAAGLTAGGFGWLLGFPALRLSGPYLAVATLGFGVAVAQVLVRWESLSGGSIGIHPPRPSFGPLVIASATEFYYLTVAVALVMAIAATNVVRSHIGRAFVAIRESEIAAQAAGVNLPLYKTLAFAVSAFYAGIGGGLMGHLVGFISPESFTLWSSIYFLSMVVIGGLGSILGSILGAVFMTGLTHALSGIKELSTVLYGAFLVLVVMFEPDGLRGRWGKIQRYWRSWPF
jgi:branched-chain amino acid transport system permease protein